jgi:hypothetical protein
MLSIFWAWRSCCSSLFSSSLSFDSAALASCNSAVRCCTLFSSSSFARANSSFACCKAASASLRSVILRKMPMQPRTLPSSSRRGVARQSS